MVRIRVRVRARVWIVWNMDAQMAVRIHTDNSPETTHLSNHKYLLHTIIEKPIISPGRTDNRLLYQSGMD